MRELYNALPDDRPVTALCVIEDPSKCPYGFSVVAKSYDQDLDADLWKDGFFGKRITRYLCLSKTEGPSGFVIDSLCIVNEKDSTPSGYILLSKTWASEQKAWRKRQLCYRMSEKSSVFLAITDIIILSKAKKAPEGFTLGGEMNGLVICYKSAPIPVDPSYQISTNSVSNHQSLAPPSISKPHSSNSPVNLLPSLKPISPSHANNKTTPVRPAPLPPAANPRTPTPPVNLRTPTPPATLNQPASGNLSNRGLIVSSSTLSGFTGLEGVPFTLGSRAQLLSAIETGSRGPGQRNSRRMRIKTPQELNDEYEYSFFTERSAILRL